MLRTLFSVTLHLAAGPDCDFFGQTLSVHFREARSGRHFTFTFHETRPPCAWSAGKMDLMQGRPSRAQHASVTTVGICSQFRILGQLGLPQPHRARLKCLTWVSQNQSGLQGGRGYFWRLWEPTEAGVNAPAPPKPECDSLDLELAAFRTSGDKCLQLTSHQWVAFCHSTLDGQG